MWRDVGGPASFRPEPGSIPESPGVYRFRDAAGPGHLRRQGQEPAPAAQLLLRRLRGPASAHPDDGHHRGRVDWTVVGTEVEALQLEYSWIKEFDPRFNVKYRDDKSYPYLAVTLGEEFPRVQVDARRASARASATSARTPTPGRSARPSTCCCGSSRCGPARPGCSSGPAQIGRPCLLGYIDKCSAPCVGRVSAEEHRELVEDFCDFMAGQTPAGSSGGWRREMRAAADAQEYERAARLRDDIRRAAAGDGEAGRRPRRRHRRRRGRAGRGPAGGRRPGLPRPRRPDPGPARLGRRQGRGASAPASWSSSSCCSSTAADGRRRGGARGRCWCPALPADAEALPSCSASSAARRVELRVPQRGDKRALMETVERNAAAGAGAAQDRGGPAT